MDRRCLGVFPMLQDTEIDAEDGISVAEGAGLLYPDIAVISLPRISNITDFRLLPGIRRITKPDNRLYRCIIIPGTKSTIGDLIWMRERGLTEWVKRQHAAGARIIGICGGYQMLGESIVDPDAVESSVKEEAGLGLLPVTTVLETEKTTRSVDAVLPSGTSFPAYEIHMGMTTRPKDAVPFAQTGHVPEGIRANNCVGTYLHGALESESVIRDLLGIDVEPGQSKEDAYESLADWFERNADMRLFEELYL